MWKKNSEIFSNGGRVLNFVTVSSSYKDSRDKVLKLINNLNWSNGFFRKDIGFKVIDKWELFQEITKVEKYLNP